MPSSSSSTPTTPLLQELKVPTAHNPPINCTKSQYANKNHHRNASPPDPLDPATPAPFAPNSDVSDDEQYVVIEVHHQDQYVVSEAGCPLEFLMDLKIWLAFGFIALLLLGFLLYAVIMGVRHTGKMWAS